MRDVSAFFADVAASDREDAGDWTVLQLTDKAIALWRIAEEVGDPALLDALRPVLVRVGRILAREITEGEAGAVRN